MNDAVFPARGLGNGEVKGRAEMIPTVALTLSTRGRWLRWRALVPIQLFSLPVYGGSMSELPAG